MTTDRRHVLTALALAFAGFAVWTMGDAAIRALRGYPVTQLLFVGALYGLFASLAFSPFLGGLRETFRKPQLGRQVLRGAVLCGCTALTYYTFTLLELPTAYAIIFLTPLCAKIVSMVLNGEKVRPAAWAVSALGLAGVLAVLRPGSMPLGVGEICALGVPVLFALGFVLARTIGEKNQTLLSLSIFMELAVIAAFATPAFIHFTPMPPVHFLLNVFCGVTGFAGTVLVSLAYARAPAAYVAPVHYSQIVWGVIWGALLFNEYPDAWTLAGAAVIIASGLALVRLTQKSV